MGRNKREALHGKKRHETGFIAPGISPSNYDMIIIRRKKWKALRLPLKSYPFEEPFFLVMLMGK
jgi:hypothetical protein